MVFINTGILIRQNRWLSNSKRVNNRKMGSEAHGITHVSLESIKSIGESIGVSSLTDDVAKELADDVTFRLKTIVQVCTVF